VHLVATDLRRPSGVDPPFPFLEVDLDCDFAPQVARALEGPADTVVALDVIEHLKRPEQSLQEIRRLLKPGGRLVASTGNVAYLVVRAMLAFGHFNYGKKGILDLTHQRLFTVRSFCRTLEGEGFRVDGIRGFGPPIRDMVGTSRLLGLVDTAAGWVARVWPGLFGYQFLVEATRLDDVDSLLDRTLASGEVEERLPAGPPEGLE
jgi:SAM-dependent methyltransferase